MEFQNGQKNYLLVKIKGHPDEWKEFDHKDLVSRHFLKEEGLFILVFEPEEVNATLRAVFDFRPQAEIVEAGLSPSPGPLTGYRKHLGSRLTLVHPGPGISPRPQEIIIKGTLAFGSGFHPTTELSARLMEKAFSLKKISRVFDLGTGSGVLAFGAARLGAEEILAADIDFRACREAQKNTLLNGLSRQVLVVCGSLDCARPRAFDLLLANLTIGTILTLAKDLINPLRPQGLLVLSGFVTAQIEEVLRALPQGQLLDKEEMEGWAAILVGL